MIDVYAWKTTNGLRATLALAECELAHRVHPIDLGAGQNRTADYLAINPTGQTPTLIDHDHPGVPFVVKQSGAIILYVCNKAKRHVPTDADRYYEALQWLMQAATDIGGTSAALQQVAVVAADKVPSNIALFEKRLIRYFGHVDQQLRERDFLAGDFSFADIAMYPNYVLRRGFIDGAADFPGLRVWAERMAERPGARAGMALLEKTE